MSFLKKATYYFALPVLVVSFISMYLIHSGKKERLEKYGKSTVGTITAVGHEKIYLEYTVAGTTYSGSANKPFPQIFIEEKYEITYNENRPDELRFCPHRPVIDSNIEYGRVPSDKIEKVWTRDNMLKFNYTVGGDNYERIQFYPFSLSDYEFQKPCMILYRIDNPKIGYLMIDKGNLN